MGKEAITILIIYLSYRLFQNVFNSLPNNKILAFTKLKAFANNIFSDAKMIVPVFGEVENIVGNGQNAGNQHFLLFLTCFQKASNTRLLKVLIVW